MACYTETKRLEVSYSLYFIFDELTKTYDGDPLFLVELKELIENLNEMDKAVLLLKIQGYYPEEIAEILLVSRRRIRQRLERIERRIREYIEPPSGGH